jgi:hypothetical protein
MNDVLFVLSSAKPGRDAEYDDWYLKHHLPDMKAVPGVTDGRFYRAMDTLPKRWTYASRYEIDRPLADVLATVNTRVRSGVMKLTESIDSPNVLMLGATPQRRSIAAERGAEARQGELCVVLGSPSVDPEGWWDDRHVPSPIAQQGVFCAQPFLVAGARGETSWTNLALYDIAPGKGSTALAALTTGSGSWRIPPATPNAENLFVGLFEYVA